MITKLALTVLLACDPALAALFTPPQPQLGTYEVCTSTAPVETFLEQPARDPERPHYGNVQFLEALDAFGTAGPYDRSRLVRLYGGRRARVVRGWTEHDGRFESTTLISPYPDATLTHLIEGTMMIRLTMDR
jgi:hypothetical protein